jgi:VWFA-related protein
VTVDLVVRDKAGGLLGGLRREDVEVYEDGVRQQVESLDFVGVTAEGAAGEKPAPVFVAVALDRLTGAAEAAAHDALVRLVEGPLPPHVFLGVFAIDRGVRTLQHFTTDRSELRDALARAAAATTFAGGRERDAVRKAYGGLATGPGQSHVAAAELASEPECRDAEDEVVRRLKILDSRMVETFVSLERSQQGRATTHALLALTAALTRLPGRKAMLLLSEGLALPADVEASFTSVLSAANQAGVSVYAADMGGLHATSAADEARRTLSSLQTRLQVQQGAYGSGSRGASAHDVNQSGLALLEKNEDMLRLDPASGLGRLADATGGFLVSQTNDVGAGLARVAEELSGYYVLSYAPARPPTDGGFRRIAVKVKRPHGRVQARQGYLALGTSGAGLRLHVEALQFPSATAEAVVPVLVGVEGERLRDVAVAIVVRDGAGAVVGKLGERQTASDGRSNRMVVTREARLTAGAYTVEAVAFDAASGASGTAAIQLDVPSSGPDRLAASSLVVVGRAEALPDTPRPSAPLAYGGVLLHPALGAPVSREAGRPLAFYLTARPAPSRPDVQAEVRLERDGRVLSTHHQALAADDDGQARLAGSLPVRGLVPGRYLLHVTLTDGRDREARTAPVTITP